MSRKPAAESTRPLHATYAAVLQVRERRLQMLLWLRAKEPDAGSWALPGGKLGAGETLEQSITRHLAAKVDVRDVAHLEQLATLSAPERHPQAWEIATAFLGIVPTDVDPRVPSDTHWHPVDALPPTAFDHGAIALMARERLRGKLSYTNVGFALAPETFTLGDLRDIYVAALGHDVSATNLKRVLLRRGVLDATGERREAGRSGGRPPELFRFRERRLEITDPFATLRPPSLDE
jgi:8-oxo-dGTP diphosphatase